MGLGRLRRAIERKSPMLLHRSIRTGSSIFANYSATGRSLEHGLCPLKWRERGVAAFELSLCLRKHSLSAQIHVRPSLDRIRIEMSNRDKDSTWPLDTFDSE